MREQNFIYIGFRKRRSIAREVIEDPKTRKNIGMNIKPKMFSSHFYVEVSNCFTFDFFLSKLKGEMILYLFIFLNLPFCIYLFNFYFI